MATKIVLLTKQNEALTKALEVEKQKAKRQKVVATDPNDRFVTLAEIEVARLAMEDRQREKEAKEAKAAVRAAQAVPQRRGDRKRVPSRKKRERVESNDEDKE